MNLQYEVLLLLRMDFYNLFPNFQPSLAFFGDGDIRRSRGTSPLTISTLKGQWWLNRFGRDANPASANGKTSCYLTWLRSQTTFKQVSLCILQQVAWGTYQEICPVCRLFPYQPGCCQSHRIPQCKPLPPWPWNCKWAVSSLETDRAIK